VAAQTVRFDTNVGNIDFLLNPTNNSNLQSHVDNLLLYVNSGRYDLSVINRAAEDFVLQFGGFTLDPLELPASFDAFTNIPSFDAVTVDQDGDGNVDFDLGGLSNTPGTVSLALGAGNPNSGTSSFFVNLGDNGALLDPQAFVPFAEVVDMATVDSILSLPQTNFAGGGLAGDDVPTINGTGVVFIERAFVLEAAGSTSATTFSTLINQEVASDVISVAFSTVTPAGDESVSNPSTFSTVTSASDGSGSTPVTFSVVTPLTQAVGASAVTSSSLLSSSAATSLGQSAALQGVAVPEPPALVLAIGALVAIYVLKPNKVR